MGIKLNEFDEMTPDELNVYVESHREQQRLNAETRSKEIITLAWHVEAFARTKELPKLETLLKQIGPQQEMKDEEILDMVQALNAAFGGVTIMNEEPINNYLEEGE